MKRHAAHFSKRTNLLPPIPIWESYCKSKIVHLAKGKSHETKGPKQWRIQLCRRLLLPFEPMLISYKLNKISARKSLKNVIQVIKMAKNTFSFSVACLGELLVGLALVFCDNWTLDLSSRLTFWQVKIPTLKKKELFFQSKPHFFQAQSWSEEGFLIASN